jgi:hypothetical protein
MCDGCTQLRVSRRDHLALAREKRGDLPIFAKLVACINTIYTFIFMSHEPDDCANFNESNSHILHTTGVLLPAQALKTRSDPIRVICCFKCGHHLLVLREWM